MVVIIANLSVTMVQLATAITKDFMALKITGKIKITFPNNTICGDKFQHAIQLLEHKLLIFPGIDKRLFQASTHENAISSYPSKHLFAR